MDLGITGKWALVCAASKGLGKGCAAAFGLKTVNSWRPVDGKAAKGWMIALLDRAGETRGLFVQMEGAQDAMTGALNGQRLDLARLAP